MISNLEHMRLQRQVDDWHHETVARAIGDLPFYNIDKQDVSDEIKGLMENANTSYWDMLHYLAEFNDSMEAIKVRIDIE